MILSFECSVRIEILTLDQVKAIDKCDSVIPVHAQYVLDNEVSKCEFAAMEIAYHSVFTCDVIFYGLQNRIFVLRIFCFLVLSSCLQSPASNGNPCRLVLIVVY